MRHAHVIILHDIHEVTHCHCQIHVSHALRLVLLEKITQIIIQCIPIRLLPEITEIKDCVSDLRYIMHGNRFDSADHYPAVTVGETTHHAHVEPDYFSIADLHIARMRVCVEEAVIHYLLDEIIRELLADFIQIIAILPQSPCVVYCEAAYILHHEHMVCGIFRIQLRSRRIYDGTVIIRELPHIRSLTGEIHLLLRDLPELIENHIKIDYILQLRNCCREYTHCLMQQIYIPLHHRIDPTAADLDNDIASVLKRGPVHLCDRSRAYRLLLYRGKNLMPVLPIRLIKDRLDLIKRHRLHI